MIYMCVYMHVLYMVGLTYHEYDVVTHGEDG